jgi:hypothetical protein
VFVRLNARAFKAMRERGFLGAVPSSSQEIIAAAYGLMGEAWKQGIYAPMSAASDGFESGAFASG